MKMLDKLNDDKYGKAKKIILVLLLLVFAFGFSLLLPFVRNIIIDTIQKLIHRQLEKPGLWHGRMILSGFITLFYDIIAIVLCYNFSKETLSFQNVFIACIFSAFSITTLFCMTNPQLQNDWFFPDYFDILAIKGYANSNLYSTNYPPLAVAIYKFFNLMLPPDADYGTLHGTRISDTYNYFLVVNSLNYILLLFIVTSVFGLYFALTKCFNTSSTLSIRKRNILALSFLLTGPFIFAIGRGNIIIYSLIFTILFVNYYQDKRKYVKEFALLSLAVAANIKLYPAAFGLLLILNKDYKAALRCFLYGILLFILPAFICAQDPLTSANNYVHAISSFSNARNEKLEELSTMNEMNDEFLETDSTPSISKIYDESIINEQNNTDISFFSKISYFFISHSMFRILLIAGLGILFTVLAQEKYQILIFIVAMCLLIPIPSYPYNMIFIFIPLIELLNKEKLNFINKISAFLMICSLLYDVGKFGCHPRTRWHFYTLVIVNIIFVITGLFSGRMKSKKHKIS